MITGTNKQHDHTALKLSDDRWVLTPKVISFLGRDEIVEILKKVIS